MFDTDGSNWRFWTEVDCLAGLRKGIKWNIECEGVPVAGDDTAASSYTLEKRPSQ